MLNCRYKTEESFGGLQFWAILSLGQGYTINKHIASRQLSAAPTFLFEWLFLRFHPQNSVHFHSDAKWKLYTAQITISSNVHRKLFTNKISTDYSGYQ